MINMIWLGEPSLKKCIFNCESSSSTNYQINVLVSELVTKLKFIFKRFTNHSRMTQDDSRLTQDDSRMNQDDSRMTPG